MVPSWSGAEAFSPTWSLEVGLSLRLGLFAGPVREAVPERPVPILLGNSSLFLPLVLP